MATSPAPDAAAPPGMCPGIAVLGGGGAGGDGDGSGNGGSDGAGGGGSGGGQGGAGDGKNGQSAPDPAKYPTCGTESHPVDVVTGRAFTHPIVDVDLPGPARLVLSRVYSSTAADLDMGLGYGWGHTLGWTLQIRRLSVRVWTAQGTCLDFDLPKLGATVEGPWSWRLHRDSATRFSLDADDDTWRSFELVDGSSSRARLTEVRDRNSNTVHVEYSEGRLVQVRDSAGRRLRVHADGDGHITSIHAQGAGNDTPVRLADYTYDARGDLVGVKDADGWMSRYEYDDEHRLVLDVDRTGLAFHFRYDAKGRCVESWGDYPGARDVSLVDGLPDRLADGVTRARGVHHCRFDYHGDGYTEVANSTQVKRYFGNAKGTLDKNVDGPGVVSRVYDPDGNILAMVDATGATTQCTRGTRGRVVSITDPLDQVTRIDRDAEGLPIRVVDAARGVTEIERDSRGNITLQRDPLGNVTLIRYDARGLPVQYVNPRGARAEMRYDDAGNRISLVQPNGGEWRWTHDMLGRVLSETDPLGNTTRFSYSPRGDQLGFVDPEGRSYRFTYDGEGQFIGLDAPHRAARMVYGGFRKFAAKTDPSGRTYRFGHDREGQLVSVQGPGGVEHSIVYDLSGRLREQRTFDGRTLRYRFDIAGSLARFEDADGKITEMAYDALGRLVERTYDDGSADAFAYDHFGNIVSAASGGVMVVFERDALGRVVKEIQTVDGDEQHVASTYDAVGARVGRETSLHHTEEITRNAQGHRTATVLNRRERLEHRVDALGLERERLLPSGGRIEHDYNPSLRVTARRAATSGATGRWSVHREYRYDESDELELAVTERGSTRYAYDPSGRLLLAERSLEDRETYSWDVEGNLHDTSRGAAERSYAKGGRLLARGRLRYAWDACSRRTEAVEQAADGDRATRFEYDDRGQLTRLSMPDGTEARYRYDAFSRRVEKRLFARDEAGALRETRRTRFVWDGGTLAHEIRTAPGAEPERWTYCYSDEGAILAHRQQLGLEDEAGEWFHYVNSPNETPDTLVDGAGNVACVVPLTTWGGVTPSDAPARTSTPLRFPGQYADEESGLSYNRFRYYDPETASFLTADPLGLLGSFNTFRYAPNPFTWTDPLGLQLNDAERAELAAERTRMGLPAAGSAADQSTVAVLNSPEGRFLGVNSRDQALTGQARLPNPYGGVGAVSPTHAEPDVLNQHAQAAGCQPPPPGPNGRPPAGSVGGNRGGSGTLLTDRDPCPSYCSRYGIQRMTEASGLDEVIVHGPTQSRRFTPGGPLNGVPYQRP